MKGCGAHGNRKVPISVIYYLLSIIYYLPAATFRRDEVRRNVAAGVRRAAGEHAKVLNAIVRDIKELKFKPKERFRELLGHTRTEVIWGMVTGILWATLVCAVF